MEAKHSDDTVGIWMEFVLVISPARAHVTAVCDDNVTSSLRKGKFECVSFDVASPPPVRNGGSICLTRERTSRPVLL